MIIYKVFSLLFGLIIGSFLNAIIYRLPLKKSIADGRSRCPHCHKLIYWYENLPVISYVFLKGRCSGCGKKISWTYPLIELVTGVFALLLTPSAYTPQSLYFYFFGMGVFGSFICIFVIDLKHKIIPNGINLYLASLFLLTVFLSHSFEHWFFGAALGILFPLSVTYLFYLLKGQIGLGGGDIKLWGALGIYLGPLGIVQNITLSCFLGAIVGLSLIGLKVVDRKTPLPFGPFIVVVAFFQIFTPTHLTLLKKGINTFLSWVVIS